MPNRDNLRTALAALQDQQHRLEALRSARERAREKSWTLASRIYDAEASLRQARAEEPSRIAYAWASEFPDHEQDISPVEVAEANLAQAQNEYKQIEQAEQALDSELAQITTRLNQCQIQVYAALADVICASPELDHLFMELDKSWARLRGIRKAFNIIEHELHGYMTHEISQKWIGLFSLDPAAKNAPTDDNPVEAWQEALSRLTEDPDAPLPDNV